jgi:hypothetical protein
MPREDVTFENRGELVVDPRTTSHELFTVNGLYEDEDLIIQAKMTTCVVVRWLGEDRSFQRKTKEPMRRLICDLLKEVAGCWGLTYEVFTASHNNGTFDLKDTTTKLVDLKVHFPRLIIRGGQRSDLETLAVTVRIQASGHKCVFEAFEQWGRFLSEQESIDVDKQQVGVNSSFRAKKVSISSLLH